MHAKGGRSGPDLTRGAYAAGESDADLFRVISSGVPGSEMPAFRDEFNEEEIRRLVSYVRSLAPANAPAVQGDRAAGEKLYWGKGACGQCHRVGLRGAAIGPDLTRAGRQRSLAYLRESIVTPDADITPGFATISVTRSWARVSMAQVGGSR